MGWWTLFKVCCHLYPFILFILLLWQRGIDRHWDQCRNFDWHWAMIEGVLYTLGHNHSPKPLISMFVNITAWDYSITSNLKSTRSILALKLSVAQPVNLWVTATIKNNAKMAWDYGRDPVCVCLPCTNAASWNVKLIANIEMMNLAFYIVSSAIALTNHMCAV